MERYECKYVGQVYPCRSENKKEKVPINRPLPPEVKLIFHKNMG